MTGGFRAVVRVAGRSGHRVHADDQDRAASPVVRSDGGCCFRTPGGSRVPVPGPLTTERADPRNPELVRMVRLVGPTEEAGSGIPRSFAAWRALGFHPPEIDVGGERWAFSLDRRYAHVLGEDDRARLGRLGEPWSEAEQLALITARDEGVIDNGTLRRLSGLHPADVTKVLIGLRNRGLLAMIGAGRGARDELDEPIAEEPGPTADVAGGRTNTEDLERSTEDLRPSTEGLAGSIRDSGRGERAPATRDTADARWSHLEDLAAPVARTTSVDARRRNDVIVRLCAVRPLSLTDPTRLLRRDPTHLRPVLRELVGSGRLRYLYPDAPRHPRQRYVAAGTSPDGEPTVSPHRERSGR
jgi:hypothetical protein